MSLNWPQPGLGSVPEYQLSAQPFVTSSLEIPASGSDVKRVNFPCVTRFVVITNTLDGSAPNVPMRVGFSENGVKGITDTNYFILNNGESFEAEFRVVDVFLMSDTTLACSGSVVAGLTGIRADRLTGLWSGSLGVG